MSSVDTDSAARTFAVDPRHHVVLEASAGTGKTTVLVQRYVNLLRAGVEPANILAITFTRKAATEMRERIIRELRSSAARSSADRARWVALRDRLSEIAISTIDAFCLSLLREFPLEADLDPGFDLADETEVPRLVDEALDRSMRIFTARADDDPDIALVIAQLGASRTRAGLAALLDRRLVAWDALDRFLARGPRHLEARAVCATAARDLGDALERTPGGLRQFLADGPAGHPRYQLFLREVGRLRHIEGLTDAAVRSIIDRISLHFLTQDGSARKASAIHPYNAAHYPSDAASKRHRAAVLQLAPAVEAIVVRFARDLNAILARGVRRMFAIALEQYRRTLDARSALDFSDILQRALDLLRRMDEFAQSRFRLESRYHHVLVDEFQDTSRAQWELVSLLVQSWGEGMGLASNPSIFIVGDRKQSIYRFRDAEVAVLHEAGRYIEGLRPGASARRSISRSFRALPELLAFVNDACSEMAAPASRPDAFTYGDSDRFPPVPAPEGVRGPVLGVSVAESPELCALAVAAEVERVLCDEVVRDRETGVPRAARAGDVAILFRSRTSHREFERALERRGIPTYVYKGLGFFDADEIKDVCALLRFLAHPTSDLRAAAFLRSGFARLSDAALAALAPDVARALAEGPPAGAALDAEDAAVLSHLRRHLPPWLDLVDRVPPADLLEEMLPETAYAFEIRGRRQQQAWENLKKMRGLIRRIQNSGYATLTRIADHIDALSAGDESNAVLEAVDAVSLMTVHASKGLEFPVVFIVNMARGAAGLPRPIRVIADANGAEASVSVGPFVSDVDALERERELDESRRLLYVAMTRARDRLYLSSALKDGALAPGRGSLAEVLPASLRPMFALAAVSAEDVIEWRSPCNRTYSWRVCMVPDADQAVPEEASENERPSFVGLLDPGAVVRRLSVTEWLSNASKPAIRGGASTPDDALVGAVVHRLFQRASLQSHALPIVGPNAGLEDAAAALLTAEESVTAGDVSDVVRRAAGLWRRFSAREDVAALLQSGTVLAEVPFSLRVEEASGWCLLRGTIDCVIVSSSGDLTVVELKTGSEYEVHRQQLELYVRAIQELFPGRAVHGRLIYQP